MSQPRGQAANWLARRLTLRVQLTLWYVALLGLVLLGFCVILDASLNARLQSQRESDLNALARQVSATLDVENGTVSLSNNSGDIAPGSVVALYTPAGGHYVSRTAPDLVATFDRAAGVIAAQPVGMLTVTAPNGEHWQVVLRPVEGEAGIYVLVAGSARELESTMSQLLLLQAFVIPLILALAVGGGLFLAARALSPIDQITRTAAEINETDLARRLTLNERHDEVGRLATTFDAMLDRLDRAFRRQSQFTADASHELRTPLSIIRSRAEIALDQPRSTDEYRQALSIIQTEAARLGGLVADMLALARVDSQTESMTWEAVALDGLLLGVVDQLTTVAEERRVALVVGQVETVEAIGDSLRLAQTVINLVDNALKYTPANGSVRVDLTREGAWVVITVTDTGVGIAEEHLPHLFERFYRIDSARTGDGAGLGLAICDWIVRAHHGKILVKSAVGKGSTFRVLLPIKPKATLVGGTSPDLQASPGGKVTER